MRRLAAWTTGVAFLAGLLSPDAFGATLMAIATFVLAFADRRAPWRWAVVSIAAWASGAAAGKILTLLEGGLDVGAPRRAGASVTVLIACVSAFAGSWVNWVASRLIRQP